MAIGNFISVSMSLRKEISAFMCTTAFSLYLLRLPYAKDRDRWDRLRHITNTCAQTDSPLTEDELVKEFFSLAEMGDETRAKIFDQIKSIVKEIFAGLHHERTIFQPLRSAFEIYGFDFLVDSNDRVYFLEANAYPDFKQTGDALSVLIKELFRNVVRSIVLPFFGEETGRSANWAATATSSMTNRRPIKESYKPLSSSFSFSIRCSLGLVGFSLLVSVWFPIELKRSKETQWRVKQGMIPYQCRLPTFTDLCRMESAVVSPSLASKVRQSSTDWTWWLWQVRQIEILPFSERCWVGLVKELEWIRA